MRADTAEDVSADCMVSTVAGVRSTDVSVWAIIRLESGMAIKANMATTQSICTTDRIAEVFIDVFSKFQAGAAGNP